MSTKPNAKMKTPPDTDKPKVKAKRYVRAWWKGGTLEEVIAGMRIRVRGMTGFAVRKKYCGGLAFEYERAAWIYEVNARLAQWKQKAKSPVYRFGLPFAALSMDEKDILRAESPSRSWKPVPTIQPWPDFSNAQPVDFLHWATTKPELIEFRVSFNPEMHGRLPLHAAIDEFLNERMKATGKKRLHKTGIREQTQYQWKHLTRFDADPRVISTAKGADLRVILTREY